MKAYVLSTIIGTGTETDPIRPALADYPVNWAIAIAKDHATNPNKNWVLAVVAGTEANLTSLSGDGRLFVLPFGPANLDQAWVTLGTNANRQTWANRISQQAGVQVSRDDPRTLREIMNLVGLAIDDNFNANNLDVRE